MVSGDTGRRTSPRRSATPVVALFGPTNSARNGPWDPRRHLDLALRRVRLPLRAAVPPRRRRAGAWGRSRRRGVCGRRSRLGSVRTWPDMRQVGHRAPGALARAARVSSARASRSCSRRRHDVAARRARWSRSPARRCASGPPVTSRRAARSREAGRTASCVIRSISGRTDRRRLRRRRAERHRGRVVIVYLGVTLVAAMRTEEAALDAKFAGEYAAYREGRAARGDRPVQRRARAGEPRARELSSGYSPRGGSCTGDC